MSEETQSLSVSYMIFSVARNLSDDKGNVKIQ